ncbi:hypothetical protein [Caldimonas brevitalea]|uniref:Uncharacterized protein n=1 Tax=Caldimonas brevitalea TaxID=413882 RepID=A0A0G3BW35_9BURK|nr:hypothetical protein [Caldimonas brevitalea]AKJ30740.1 hypothetical protein AAW51_4049 [Caldimonas brevitalea]
MQILEAYCEELDRVVDIYEAREEFIALPLESRRRFTFRCSDVRCRISRKPQVLVSGVNYDKVVEETERYVQPHYRALNNHPHLDDCVWVVGERKRQKAEPVDPQEPHGRTPRAKGSDFVDFFDPPEFDTPSGSVSAPVPNSIEKPESEEEPGHQRGPRDHGGVTTTSKLERFIDCWAQLDVEARKQEHITLNKGERVTYYQAVLPIRLVEPHENGARVVCGGARVKLWPQDKPKFAYINFIDACERFELNQEARTLTIELPLSRVDRFRGGALMRQRLEKATARGHYLRMYVWGVITPHPKRPGYLLEVAALDNLVLKVIKSKAAVNQQLAAQEE